jgi:hypothetical protein
MKTNSNKTTILQMLAIICLVLISAATHAQQKISDFHGTWILNEQQSDFGRLTAASATKLKMIHIEQANATVTVITGDSTMKTVSALKFDGTPSGQIVSTVINGIPNTLSLDLALQTVNDHQFVTTAQGDPINGSTASVKTFTLSADGRTLTIAYKNSYGTTEMTGKLFFDKQ